MSARSYIYIHRQFAVQFVSLVIGLDGLYILATTLLDQLAVHHGSHLTDIIIDVPLLIGLSVLYLSTLLRRRKRMAWVVTVAAYAFYLGLGVMQLLAHPDLSNLDLQEVIRRLMLPLLVLSLLFIFEKEFIVKSDIQGFRFALRFVAIILLVALAYGVSGFVLLDESDFHKDVNIISALHYTIDQFDLTTQPLQLYTKRAHLFVDSLSFVSIGALAYAAVSLFQPLRVRLSDQHNERRRFAALLKKYGAPSEEFFKIWPHDKHYYFDQSGDSGLAFHVYKGVALCVSDPVGDARTFGALLDGFQSLCFSNDWLPAQVHVSDNLRPLYEKCGYAMQKLGEEAVLNLHVFQTDTANGKYFRQIRNKFKNHGYSAEILQPPHHPALIGRLQVISDDWLQRGGRAERGFVMGYFTAEYLQQCQLVVARDAAGTIQGFVSLVPAAFDTAEVTYDLLRHQSGSLGNINDFLLLSLIDHAATNGFQRLNLGLCPLAGLDETSQEQRTFLDSVLQFAYTNGDRFYSFNGLRRFKAKYHPEWHDRYVAYQGGVRGFSRTMTALTRTMRSVVKL